MKNDDNTNAAALLLAVLVAIVGPMVNDGAWEFLDTIIAAVVATILWCFTWPRKRDPFSARWAVAHALVYGLIAGTGLAWIAQSIMWSNDFTKVGCDDRLQPYADRECVGLKDSLDLAASQATTTALYGAAVVAIVVFFVLIFTRVKKRKG